MRKIFAILISVLCFSAAMVAQQARSMKITMKNGEVIEYLNEDVKNLTFTEDDTPIPTEFSVSFNADEITSTSARVTITPNDNNKSYYAQFWIKSYMVSYDGTWLPDDQLIATCAPDPNFYSKCYTGVHTVEGKNFLPESELVLIVFDADARNTGTGKVFKYEVKTLAGSAQDAQFTITNQNVGYTDVSFHAKANDPSGFVMARIVKTSDFESYGETVMQNLYFGINNAAVERSMKISEYVQMNGGVGECDFNFTGLLENTNYTVAVFYVDPENNDPTNVYDWNYTRWDLTTKKATSVPEVEVTDAVKTNIGGNIEISYHVKTNNAVKIYASPKPAADVEPYLNDDYESWSNLFISWAAQSESVVEAANSPEGTDIKVSGLADGEYYVLVRAINEQGGTKTVVTKVTDGGYIPDTTPFSVEFAISDLTPATASVIITPSNNTKRYYAQFWIKSYMVNYDGSWLPDDQLIATCAPDPNFDSKCHTGQYVLSGKNFMPESELVVIVFDAEARNTGKGEVFKYEVTTLPGGSENPQFTISNENVGYTDVSFHAVANDPNGFVMARVVKTSDFESYGQTVMQNLYFGINNAALERSMKISEFVQKNGNYGECDFSFTGLLENTDYTVAVFYVDPENNDPTNVYDWRYTRWDFTTKKATSVPAIEVTNAKKTSAGGKINISFHVKTNNAVKLLATPKPAADVDPYINDDYESWSDLFISWRAQSESVLEAANSPEGTVIEVNGLDPGEYYIVARAINEQGGKKTVVVKVE